jgi:hypothetical protein
VRLVLDLRIGADVAEVWAVAPGGHAVSEYEESLEGEALEEPCTRRMIAYGPFLAAAVAASLLRRWARGESFPPRVTTDLVNFWMDRTP